ncbi:hypothetical protein [Microbacterium sp. SA39]|uniref:hypothetical protein n=1 Tax=Microbacterium sp. SA39 TaxID=1263625 RepID=UPI00061E6EA2|nr:hypothetical protein [Microbacterium sp. SA39]KJQ54391.1 hypothetical protein RS85_01993 [Microbacterium sp. SA39]
MSHSDHARQLGEVIIAWSNVTDRVERLFIDLADLNDPFVVGVFVEKIRDGQLDEVVHSLAAKLEDSPRDAIRDWIRRVRSARKQRNEYLHGVYLPQRHSDGQEHLYLLGRRVLDRNNATATPAMTKLLSSNLIQLHQELLDLQRRHDELVKEHFPWPVRRSHGEELDL